MPFRLITPVESATSKPTPGFRQLSPPTQPVQQFSDDNPYAPLVRSSQSNKTPNDLSGLSDQELNQMYRKSPKGLGGQSPYLTEIMNRQSSGKFGQTGIDNAGKAIDFLTNTTIKPIAKVSGMIAGTVGSEFNAMKGAASKLLQGGNFDEINKAASDEGLKPVEVFGENQNPLRADEQGNIDKMASTKQVVGTTLQGAAGAFNTAGMFNPAAAIKFLPNFLSGAAMATGEGLKEGKGGWETVVNSLISGGLQGGLAFTLGKLLSSKAPKSQEEISAALKNEALKNGVKENYANTLSTLNPEQKQIAMDYLDAGIEKLNNPVKAPSVFQKVGQEVDDFLVQAKDLLKNKGGQLGAAKQGMEAQKLPTEGIRTTLDDVFNKLNIKPTEKGLDFSLSPIKRSGDVTTQIQDIYNLVKEGGEMSAKDLEALTGQIDEMTGLLKSSGLSKSQASNTLTQIKSSINDTLSSASPEFGASNKDYAQLVKLVNQVKKAAEVPVGGGQAESNGAQILRRSLGNADTKYNAAIKAMDKIEELFGLPAPKDLTTKAHLADLAEKYTGTAQPQGFQGGIEAGTQAIPGRVGSLIKTARDIKQFIAPTPEIEQQALKLKSIIEKSMSPLTEGGHKLSSEGQKAIQGLLQLFRIGSKPNL